MRVPRSPSIIAAALGALVTCVLLCAAPFAATSGSSSAKNPAAVLNGPTVNIGQSGGTVGFFGVTPASRAAAYTQTYSTALRTVPAATTHTLTDSSGGTPSTTAVAAMTGVDGTGSNAAPLTATKNNIATLAAEQALLAADLVALKKVVNALIDDQQAYGLAQ